VTQRAKELRRLVLAMSLLQADLVVASQAWRFVGPRRSRAELRHWRRVAAYQALA
jgi:hypothetical protein